jgi:CRISPR-associated protein Cst2
MLTDHNLFATVLTHAAPSSNYRGESEENRTVIQRISRKGQEYAVISPEAMRNALREQLALRGLDLNRRRLHDEDQLAVEYQDFPDASRFADDFLFGYLVADNKEMKKAGRPAKRDSVLRMNLAVALSPFRYDATFHQSPLNAGKSPWRNATTSVLLHREASYTAYQYPFALALRDCSHDIVREAPRWATELLRAIGELSNVAGGHARSLFEMAPRSIVARLSRSLVAGYDSYGFAEDGSFRELDRLRDGDLPTSEFWLGGEIVRSMPAERRETLQGAGAHLHDNPQQLLAQLAATAFGNVT